MFAKELLTNFVATFLPSGGWPGVALSLATIAAIFLLGRLRSRLAILSPQDRWRFKVIAPFALICVSVAGLLGGLYWLSQTANLPNEIAPFTGLSDPQLRVRANNTARELRDLENASHREIDDSQKRYYAETSKLLPVTTEEGKAKLFELRERWLAETNAYQEEARSQYRARYHVEANQLYNDLCRRLKLVPAQYPMDLTNLPQTGLSGDEYQQGISALRTGMLTGPRPLAQIADILDRLASGL